MCTYISINGYGIEKQAHILSDINNIKIDMKHFFRGSVGILENYDLARHAKKKHFSIKIIAPFCKNQMLSYDFYFSMYSSVHAFPHAEVLSVKTIYFAYSMQMLMLQAIEKKLQSLKKIKSTM